MCENNIDLQSTPTLPLKREGVLFLTQRRQATSDYRSNKQTNKQIINQTNKATNNQSKNHPNIQINKQTKKNKQK